MNDQARQIIIALQSLGKMTERVLSNPLKNEVDAPLFFDGYYDSTARPSLLDVWRGYDPTVWTVDRLEGGIYTRNVLTPKEKQQRLEWGDAQLPDDANFKAVILCVMRTKEMQPAVKTTKPSPYRDLPEQHILNAQCAKLIASNVDDLVLAFTGHPLSRSELLEIENKGMTL